MATVLPACSAAPWRDEVRGRLRIATGNTGAVFDRYGRALAQEVARALAGVRADTTVTAGSIDNIRAVLDGEADVAFSLGDSAVLAVDGQQPFAGPQQLTAVARLYDSFLQVVVPDASDVVDVTDLAGRRVAAGERESGTRLVMGRCLVTAGVEPGDVALDAVPLAEATSALVAGEVDALAFVSGFPIPALVDLGRRIPLRAVDLGALVPDLVDAYGPEYVVGPLPAGPYGLARGVETVSIKTYMLAAPALDAALAHAFTSVIFERQDAIARVVPDVRQPTAAAGMFTQPVPLHPGSLRWFRERDAQAG